MPLWPHLGGLFSRYKMWKMHNVKSYARTKKEIFASWVKLWKLSNLDKSAPCHHFSWRPNNIYSHFKSGNRCLPDFNWEDFSNTCLSEGCKMFKLWRKKIWFVISLLRMLRSYHKSAHITVNVVKASQKNIRVSQCAKLNHLTHFFVHEMTHETI